MKFIVIKLWLVNVNIADKVSMQKMYEHVQKLYKVFFFLAKAVNIIK